MPWKDEREPTIKYCMGRQIDVVQKFTRIQSFGQNWWWANGIRVKCLPRIHHIAALQQSPRVLVKNERKARKISLDGSSSSRCSTTSHGDQKTMNGNEMLTPTSFRFMREDFQQDNGHSSDLDQQRSGILLTNSIHKESGTGLRNRWC